ncbi:MAG: hypothetical protein IT260_05530 [Saprospiraceae bacterium]|nr:hypothetical protein [Saprospiraceae bacterium]
MRSFFSSSTSQQPQTPAKNKKQIAAEMGISLRTLQRRLKDVDMDVPRGLICPKTQRSILERLGWER